jgi:hypothetical protein
MRNSVALDGMLSGVSATRIKDEAQSEMGDDLSARLK